MKNDCLKKYYYYDFNAESNYQSIVNFQEYGTKNIFRL